MRKTIVVCLGAVTVVSMVMAAGMSSSQSPARQVTFRCDGPVPVDHTVIVEFVGGVAVGYLNANGDRVQLPPACWPLTAGPIIREKK